MTDSDGHVADGRPGPPAHTAEVTDRAVKGMAAMGMRAVVIRILGLSGNLVLAPLLGPSGYGIVAIGMIFMTVSRFVSDGGLNAAFLSREATPTREQLRAMVGFQLLMTGSVAAVAWAAVPVWGGDAVVVALMASSLPLVVLRVPTTICLERELRYRLIIRADIIEALLYNALAIGLVLAGFGVLGVGIATAVKALVGTSILLAGGPVGFVAPTLRLGPLRDQVRFGVFFQLAWVLTLIRDEGLGVLIALIGGTAALGAWSLARRLLIVLSTVFETAWRVALPGLARMREAGASTARIMEQGLSIAALGTGIPVVGLVATVPALVPALFGDAWGETVAVVPWLAAGLMLGVPVGTVLVSLLWVQDEADRVLYLGIPSVVVSLALGAALLGPLGVEGAAIGYFVGQAVFFASCLINARDLFTGRAVWGGVAPTLAAAAASWAGYELALRAGSAWVGVAAGLLAGLTLYVAALAILDLPGLRRMGRLAGRGTGMVTG